MTEGYAKFPVLEQLQIKDGHITEILASKRKHRYKSAIEHFVNGKMKMERVTTMDQEDPRHSQTILHRSNSRPGFNNILSRMGNLLFNL